MCIRDRLTPYADKAEEATLMDNPLKDHILAGAFAQSAKQMGAIDATVNLTLHILPDNLLLAGIFIAACFISLSLSLIHI